MLDIDTKRRIDTARDILVGKVPDPKSQVEQITIALIYKFMNDIDAESEKFGGERLFFTGEFEKYRWANLVHSGLGGVEMLDLYVEALIRIPENPNIPPLFRAIFNNVYLPYRDPETLRMFFNVIDDFTYDHSERLGDAFEHLLSVMGSQGDAGQFRTPRHIIDFMVKIIDPQKHERVLDPACGTAGFLVSSYKHILSRNSDESGRSALTPDERNRVVSNLTGYDISPDMVRLSRVNMYLHGFPSPNILEYDTLTSEERWDEYADVILANPPFMSPKGGIRPHSRFSVQSRRSEVLFVDYIAEHLTPGGRAGVIVPEGVIFQSQNAHKQLRKMLVEDYLVAVVSLPAGVFQPYSGVKTSILVLDRAAARRAEHVAFFKVESDGYDLGAQRRPIAEDDLPAVETELAEWLRHLQSGEPLDDFRPAHGFVVEKERIGEDGEYSLSGERYRETSISTSDWPLVTLKDACIINPESINPTSEYPDESIFYVDISSVENGTGRFLGYTEIKSLEAPSRARRAIRDGDILLSTVRPNLKAFTLLNKVRERAIASTGFAVIRARCNQAEPAYILASLFSEHVMNQMVSRMGRGAYPSINEADISAIKIVLPPLEVQREIVAEIEGYQRVIDGARAVVDSWKPHIAVDLKWPMVEVKDIASVQSGSGFPLKYQGETDQEIHFLKVSDMNTYGNEVEIKVAANTVSRSTLRDLGARSAPPDTVIFPKIGAAIKTNKKRILIHESAYDNNVMGIIPDRSQIEPRFLYAYLQGFDISNWASSAQPPSMRKTIVESHHMPLPPIETQRAIVAEIEAERAIVDANRELVERMEARIAAAIGRVWGG